MKAKPVGRLMAGAFLLWMSVYTYPSFLPAYVKADLGATSVFVGMVVGSYGFTQMLLRIPLGVLSDVLRRRKPFLVGGMVASLLSAAGLAVVKTPAGALIFRGLAGVAVSTWVAHIALYSQCFDPSETADAMGRLSAAQYGSQMVAMLLGGLMAQHVSTAAAFALGALAAVAGFVVVAGVPETPIESAPSARVLLCVVGDRALLVSALLATVFQFAAWGTVLGFTANWASEVVGLGASALGLLSAALQLTNAVLSRFSGPIARKFGERRALATGFIACAAASALFAFSYSAPLLFASQMLFGAGMGLLLPITVSGSVQNIEPERRGAAAGFYQSVYGAGMFLGPVVAGGIVKAFGYRANFFSMAGILALGAALTALWRLTGPRSST
jgi:MFS family permease